MSANKVQQYLNEQGLEVLNFPVPTPDSVTAAAAVGCSVAEIAKCVLMMVAEQPVLVVTSGDTRVKSSRLKRSLGRSGRVRLPVPEEVQQVTGFKPGAVSPFLLPEALPVLVDHSLQRFARVYPAAGNERSAVGLSCDLLLGLCAGKLADVCDITED